MPVIVHRRPRRRHHSAETSPKEGCADNSYPLKGRQLRRWLHLLVPDKRFAGGGYSMMTHEKPQTPI